MDSWLIIIVLMVLLMISISIIFIYLLEIRKMTSQLEEIIENFGTNELVRTNTHNKSMDQFIKAINRLIHQFKQDQQQKEKRELELKQEITNISHDLRTPLTSIKGFSELLQDPALSDEERKESLSIIQKKIDSLTMMVDLFYELSQMNSSDYHLVMEEQNLNQIMIDIMLMFYNDFEEKGLNVQVDEEHVPSVLADKKAANRIVINIIQNALHYAKSTVTIILSEESEYIRLSVSNDIHEFNEAELHRIFDRTFRLDTSRSGGQLGLGLHIVKQLIQKQGGKVISNVQNNEFRMDVLFRKWD